MRRGASSRGYSPTELRVVRAGVAAWEASDDEDERCENRAATLRLRGVEILEADPQPPVNPRF